MTIAAIDLLRWGISMDLLLILTSFFLCQKLLQWNGSYGGKEHLVWVHLRENGKTKQNKANTERCFSKAISNINNLSNNYTKINNC